jgi:AraC family transcriptional regulator of adaptative response / DNA-3-methyladenine glycosylase II
VRQRVKALQALAAAVADGTLELHPAAPLEATLDRLRALPGIGEWTAQVIAMRALGWPDAWPATDIGLMNALGTRDPKQVAARAEAWRPWRAYAVMALWHRLENTA